MTKNDLNTCYYSPNEKHELCTHKDWCILKKERVELEEEIIRLTDKLERLTRQYYSQLSEYGGDELIDEKELRIIKEDLTKLKEYYNTKMED